MDPLDPTQCDINKKCQIPKFNYGDAYNCAVQISSRSGSGRRFTQHMIDSITLFVNQQNANPTGIWADFRCVQSSWRALAYAAQSGYISSSDLPAQPNPSDYPNIDLPATHDCGNCQCSPPSCRGNGPMSTTGLSFNI